MVFLVGGLAHAADGMEMVLVAFLFLPLKGITGLFSFQDMIGLSLLAHTHTRTQWSGVLLKRILD